MLVACSVHSVETMKQSKFEANQLNNETPIESKLKTNHQHQRKYLQQLTRKQNKFYKKTNRRFVFLIIFAKN